MSAERIAALSAAGVRFPEYTIAALNELGPAGNLFEYRWNRALQALRRYKELHGNADPPDGYKTPPPDSFALGKWLRRQRKEFRDGKLSAERIAALSAAGVRLAAGPARGGR
ncbi:helicase associated domain-containing protein [Streptomyces sp. NPDC002676]